MKFPNLKAAFDLRSQSVGQVMALAVLMSIVLAQDMAVANGEFKLQRRRLIWRLMQLL